MGAGVGAAAGLLLLALVAVAWRRAKRRRGGAPGSKDAAFTGMLFNNDLATAERHASSVKTTSEHQAAARVPLIPGLLAEVGGGARWQALCAPTCLAGQARHAACGGCACCAAQDPFVRTVAPFFTWSSAPPGAAGVAVEEGVSAVDLDRLAAPLQQDSSTALMSEDVEDGPEPAAGESRLVPTRVASCRAAGRVAIRMSR